MNRSHTQLGLLVLGIAQAANASSSDNGVHRDLAGDAVVRRTDAGGNAPMPPGFVPIDLIEVGVQGWETGSPQTNPYIGNSTGGDADLMRIQIIVDGLVSPPGPIALDASPFAPQLFGERPLYGYFELDVDAQRNTGGEFMPLARNRYLANVGRFGCVPSSSINARMVRKAGDLDLAFNTVPQFERSGAEFTLVLCGCFTPQIVSQDGNMDSIFDAGETWIVRGRFFERMAAFAPESALFGGSDFGHFDPVVNLRFSHDIATDQTSVTLIFPVTNSGAAELLGQPEQPIDLSLLNQTSIAEALDDLIEGASFTTGNLFTLVGGWRDRDVDDFYRPRDWSLTAIVGSVSPVQDPAALFVWTDTGFDEVRGDVDGDQLYTPQDCQQLHATIQALDGGPDDADGIINTQVLLNNFAYEFNLGDLNYDGMLSELDVANIPQYLVEPIASFTTTTTVRGASDAGHVVGDQAVSGLSMPFVAVQGQGLTLLPLPTGYISGAALDANSSGVIVGTVSDTNFPFDQGEPAIWTPDIHGVYSVIIPQQFATLPGPLGTTPIDGGQAFAINDKGTIVGWSRLSGFKGGPTTRFSLSQAPVDLNAFGFSATVTDLSEKDVIVGDGQRLDLNTMIVTNLGVPPEGQSGIAFTFVRSFAINDQNQVVGAAHLATVGSDRWLTYIHDDLNGWQPHNIAQLPDTNIGFYDINNNGDISATGGPRFAPEGVIASDYDALLASGQGNWNTSIGFIADDRRVYTTAFNSTTGQSSIVVLVPDDLFPPCIADLNTDGQLNFFDVSIFLIAFNTMQPLADFTGDGQYNFFDVSMFLTAFIAGCP